MVLNLNIANFTSIFVDSHRSVPLCIVDLSAIRAVDRNLIVVSSKSMSVSIAI